MLLTIDAGNSNITIGVYEGKRLLFLSRLTTSPRATETELAIKLKSVFELYNITSADIKGAVICSVVPDLTAYLAGAVKSISGCVPLLVGPGVKTGLCIKIDNPAQLGTDLVAAAVAACEAYPLPCIIVDMGTATKLSVLDSKGDFLGVTISAGLHISLEALASRTAQLPYISIEPPQKIIGTNTVESMKSGIVAGTAAMIDGLAERIEQELGEAATIVATGGLAKEVISCCRRQVIYAETLILEGLRIIFEKNRKD